MNPRCPAEDGKSRRQTVGTPLSMPGCKEIDAPVATPSQAVMADVNGCCEDQQEGVPSKRGILEIGMDGKLIIPNESLELQKMVAGSMSRYTFGIVQPSAYGVENQELATGVGISWDGMHLILTAAHVIAHCPEQTLRYFLPARNIEYAQSANPRPEIRALMELANPQTPIFADGDLDLAVVKLPFQSGATEFFNPLQGTDVSPKDGVEVGVLGYPSSAKIPWNGNYVAGPLHFYGKLDVLGKVCTHPPVQDFTIPYGLPYSPKGFSGSGVWFWPDDPLWTPKPRLVGIIARHCEHHDILSGYNIESVVAFLNVEADLLAD